MDHSHISGSPHRDISSLSSSSATAPKGVCPSTVEDPTDSGTSGAINQAKALEPLIPSTVVLNTGAARNFSTARGRVHGTPVWREAMGWHDISWHIARCMYINGQISVGGKRACSLRKNPPCQRCQRSGRECWIRDPEKETLVKLDKCGECLRIGGKPCLFDAL